YQQERHCFLKLDTEKTQPLKVPFVQDYFIPPENLLEYEKEVYDAQAAIPGPDADRLLKENETRFLSAARAAVGITPANSYPPVKDVTLRSGRTSARKKTVFETIETDPIGRE